MCEVSRDPIGMSFLEVEGGESFGAPLPCSAEITESMKGCTAFSEVELGWGAR